MSSSIKKDSDSFAGAPANVIIDAKTAQELEAETDAHLGVKTVEAAEKVYGKYSKWWLFIGYAPRTRMLLVPLLMTSCH